MSRNLTIAVTQMACTPDFEKNRDRAEKLIRDAASKGAQVILLQELFEGPYFCKDQNPDYFNWAQPAENHPLLEQFSTLAKELEVVLPISFFESIENVFSTHWHFSTLMEIVREFIESPIFPMDRAIRKNFISLLATPALKSGRPDMAN